MVGLQTLDLAIGVRVPASQPNRFKYLPAAQKWVARLHPDPETFPLRFCIASLKLANVPPREAHPVQQLNKLSSLIMKRE